MKSKTCVFSDSVPCLGGISPEAVQAWKDKIKWYLETRYLKELDRIDGEPMEFEWQNFPGFASLGILTEIQKMIVNLSNFKEGSSSCPCTMTLYGRLQEMKKVVLRFFLWKKTLQHTPKAFHSDLGHIWDLVVRKSGMELMSTSQMVNGTKLLRS